MSTIVVNGLSAIYGGGQTYLRNLADHLPQTNARVIAILPEAHRGLMDRPGIEVVCPPFAARGVVQRALWERYSLPRLLREVKADVLYGPGGTVPATVRAPCRTAVAFRNMIPFAPDARGRYGWGYMFWRLMLLRWLQARAFTRADLVIFISEHGKEVIDAACPGRRGRSALIPHGVAEAFREPSDRGNLRAIPPDTEYVLYVSIVDVYKAQLEVVEAWAQVRRARPEGREKLVLAGPLYPPYGRKVRDLIARLGLERDVILTGAVPGAELPALCQNAKVNVFASACENCPNILLELLAAGRPVISSSAPPMPEFAGDAARYFDPYRPAELSRLLLELLGDRLERDRLGELAAQRSRRFDVRASALATWEALFALAAPVKP